MSTLQRIIVRLGNEADVPALHFAELGMDRDTITMRIGDDTPDPPKIMTTKSTTSFDFSSVTEIVFGNIRFAPGTGIEGVDFADLKAEQGIVISLGDGNFRQTTIVSGDNSVIVNNGDGQTGLIDLRVSSESITNALGDIRVNLIQLTEDISAITDNYNNNNDTLLKLVQLTGAPIKATELGEFLGVTIPDNATIKTALQALETALEGLGNAAFDLELTGRAIDQWGLQLTDTDYVIFETATPDLAGLMHGDDKFKLDFISVTSPITLEDIAVTEVIPDSLQARIINSNATEVIIPAAQGSNIEGIAGNAGLLSADDKKKLNFLNVTEILDLDDLEDRVTVVENFQISPTLYAEKATGFSWESTDTVTNTVIDVTPPTFKAFAVIYRRFVEGFETAYYDAITLNGIDIVEAENVTKGYEGAVIVVKGRNNLWHYIDHRGLAVQIGDISTVSMLLDIGDNNFVSVKELKFI